MPDKAARALIICMMAGLLALVDRSAFAAPRSKATLYLLNQQIEAGCESGAGRFHHQGVFEVDLNGDGKLDLVLSHQGLHCKGRLERSSLCGAQFCTILVYYRRGQLLKKQDEFLGYILSFRPSPEPVFDIAEMNGRVAQWHPRSDGSPWLH
ncbi:hypothetical protein [Cohaesibacter marisflavi]|uniref:hypothetical protein n=1 Tax=Cohaesibacter marisflavi TaxID=655353 RepID=UPI0029C81448|nr:hypothetical protein [Cohaesibacter marisflavi]